MPELSPPPDEPPPSSPPENPLPERRRNPLAKHAFQSPPFLISRRSLLAAALAGLGGCLPTTDGNRDPALPQPRVGADWWDHHHAEFKLCARYGPAPLLFLGDSLVQGWLARGQDPFSPGGWALWQKHYQPRGAVNFGLSSDRTEHLLWRIRDMGLGNLDTQVVILLIGTNNLEVDQPAELARGIKAVIDEITKQAPGAHLILHGLLPRAPRARKATEPRFEKPDARVPQVNRLLSEFAAPRIRYLDLGPQLTEPDGLISRDLFPDMLHLSFEGYRRWANALDPILDDLLPLGPNQSPNRS